MADPKIEGSGEDHLETMRHATTKVLIALAWTHVPIAAAAAYAAGNDVLLLSGVTAVFALLATFARQIAGKEAGRAVLLIALQAQAASLVAALSGHPWQVDGHMYFFALMGVGATLVDARAVIGAAAAIAVHHLGLNFLAAALVYPGGTDLGRTVLHAVILAIETGGLLYAIQMIKRSLADSTRSKEVAEAELANANEARANAQRIEREAEEERRAMMAELEASFGEVVTAAENGDLSRRARTDFQAEELNRLSQSVNRLVERIEQTLSAAAGAMEKLASGDLRAKMPGTFEGRYADLQQGINATTDQLSNLVASIRAVSERMANDTSHLASTASDQASRAQSQAASLEETSATMEEMSATIKSNSDSADRGQRSASEAAQRAERGGQVVSETVEAMGRIEEGAGRISNIISVIDGIAFQTNLLALNAAVEAARAGDAGKGFAVVASEVRSLAQRSAEAARDITSLISESAEHVKSGVTLVNRTGTSLEEIVEAINGVAATVSEISEATHEQSSAIDEISSAISGIDQMTQENASVASSSASTARSLAEQGEELSHLVSAFTIDAAHRVREAAADAMFEEAASARAPAQASRAAAPPSVAANESWAEF